ncbi:MAG: WYL domain-containing protein [Verrucomicrobia bacterium]|nr:WYL domain-containing protein [Verrucomicrobiota bacterium]
MKPDHLDPKTRPPLERMMKIHQAIQAGRHPNVPMLSAELGVAAKTIYRDLDFMRDRLGLPMKFDAFRNGWHYTEPVDAFPTMQITEGELVALLIAEKALQQYRGTNFERPLLSALKKLQAAMPDTVSLSFAEWDKTISFRTSAEPIVNLKVMDSLGRAAARRCQLQIAYRKPGTPKAESRIVDPYHLANINGEWFLFAFDHLRRDVRTFVPARIQSVKETGKTFSPPAKFSVEQRLRDSFGVHSGKGEHRVVVRFSCYAADYVREKRWHPSQKLRELRGRDVELRLKLSSLVEIKRWILSWGGEAKVIAPRELAEEVRLAARQIARNY